MAHAHLLAADKLVDGSVIAGNFYYNLSFLLLMIKLIIVFIGQVYFITNDEPRKLWDIMGNAYEQLGFGRPYIKVPTVVIWHAFL